MADPNEDTIDWGMLPYRPGKLELEVCVTCGSFRIESTMGAPSCEVMAGHSGAGRQQPVSECQDCGGDDITTEMVEAQ